MSIVIDKVANKKKNLHKFLTTAYNPQRRQHFQVRKYLKEGRTEAAVEYMTNIVSGRPRLKCGKKWVPKEQICSAPRQQVPSA